MTISKNMVADYATDNTGVADAGTKFYNNLKPEMAGQDVLLTIPVGEYNFITAGGGDPWATGMTSLSTTATGAHLYGAGGVILGAKNLDPHAGIDDASGISARIQTVSAGATSVTLSAASASAGHISRANVGRWMLVCSYDIQGLFQAANGFPPNFHFIDYVQITGIVGNVISFTPALQNNHLSTYPEMNRGNSIFEIDAGGPASVYFLHADWGATIAFTGPKITNSNLIGCGCLDFTITNGESDNLPVFPSINKTWRAINHTISGAQVEVDKLIDLAVVQGGTHSQWFSQSSSCRMFTMTGTTVTGALNGTPRNAVVDGCTIAGLNIGPTSHGRADSFIGRNSTITGNVGGGLLERGPSDVGVNTYMFMSGGIITIPKSVGYFATRVFPPDASGRNVLLWSGNSGTISGFKVLAVTQDPWPGVDNQFATTNVTMSSVTNKKNLGVSSAIFTSGDAGKVIEIPGASSFGTLYTFIVSVTDSQNVVVFDDCTATLSASSRTLRWGTSNVYVQTDQAGGLPNSALYNGTGKLAIQVPPARSVYFENCTGSAQILDLCQSGAQNKPLYSYTKRTYDGTTGATGGPQITLWGNVTSIKVNVTKAYTGVSSLTCGFAQFDNYPVVVSGAYTTYGPRFNLKVVGERVITVGNTTGTQSGDTNLGISSATWFGGAINPSMSRDISGESSSDWPSFTIEVITDQGFPSPASAARVRLRVR